MRVILEIILMLLGAYRWVLVGMIILSWLISFNVINTRNQFVEALWRILNQLTEPFLRPIRRYMPDLGGLDLSPLVLFFAIYLIEQVILRYIYPYVF